MVHRIVLVALLGALLPSRGRGQSPACSGTLTGAVRATFACSVSVTRGSGEAVDFTISAAEAIAGVRSFKPASFALPGQPSVQVYRLESLGRGESFLQTSRGKVFRATRAGGDRGAVELALDTVERERSAPGSYTVSGSLHARLVAEGKPEDVVILDVTF